MREGPSPDVQPTVDALVGRLMEATRGPLPLDVGINLAMRVIFVRWSLSQCHGGRDVPNETQRASAAPDHLIESELARTLHHAPQVDTGGLVSKAVSAMWHTLGGVLSGDQRRDLSVLRSAFESVLKLYRTQGLRGASEYMGPDPIVRLSMAAVGKQATYIDPSSGYGTTLRAAHLLNEEAALCGFDTNEHALAVAEMRLRIHGGNPELSEGDAFENARRYGGQFGGVIVQPPWNALTDSSTVARRAELLGDDLPLSSLRTDLAWIELSLHLLAPGGRGAVFLTHGSASSEKGQEKSYQRLLDLGAVEAVIDFPQGGMAIGAAVPTALWILRKQDDLIRTSDVLLIDASALVQRDRGGATLNDVAIGALATLLDVWRLTGEVHAPGYLAKALSVDQFDLELKGMLPSRYLDEVPEEKVSLPEPPKRLISRIAINGYKAFSGPTSIDLAPLTLVYGANSAGKSSIIQSLLLLKQSVQSDHLVTQGEWADVGNFEGISSGHRNEDIEFGIEYGSLPSWIPEEGTADPAMLRDVRFIFSSSPSETSSNGAIRQLKISWGDHHLPLRSSADGRFRVSLDLAEPVMKGIVAGNVLFPFEVPGLAADDPDTKKRLRYRESNVRTAVRHFEKAGDHDLAIVAGGLLPSSDVEYSRTFRTSYPERQRSTDMSYTNRTARLVAGIGSEVRALLGGISYLGPLRSAPQRYYDRSSNGGRPGDGYETAMLLYNNNVVVESVNEWLAHLEVPYDLQMLSVEAQAGVASLVGDLVVMALTDLRSGIQVTPADVGYGVSQVLPIVVKLLAETDSVVCIEQPETHLHPRLQARLADLLINSASVEGQGNQLIVETHSEHLMLRIQRRIRERALSPNDVAVLYVDQDKSGRAEVLRIRLSEDGDFLDEWPEGFFEERLDEIFGEII